MRTMWLALLAGCGLGDARGWDVRYVGEPVAYEALPDAFATATCDRRERCGDLGDDGWEDCHDLFEGLVWSGWLDEGDGCLDYDAQAGGNCVAAHEQAPCAAGHDLVECVELQTDVCGL